MIDYDNLKKAHEVAANLFEHFVIEINIMHGAIGSESGRLKYNYNYQTMGWDNEIPFPHVEYLLCELQKLQKPEPKYKAGQIVYLMGDDNNPVDSIKVDEIIYEDGEYWYLVYRDEGGYSYDGREFDQYREGCLYPSKEAFIESQIQYWTDLKQECDSVTDCHQLECNHEPSLYAPTTTAPLKCKHCGGFFG